MSTSRNSGRPWRRRSVVADEGSTPQAFGGGSRVRRGRLALLVVLIGAGLSLVFLPSALAVHDAGCALNNPGPTPPAGTTSTNFGCLFELDGNVANDPLSAGNNGGYDWGSGPGGNGVFTSGGAVDPVVAADPQFLSAAFNADYALPDNSTFATSNKDIDNISSWNCGASNNVLNKDDILNAYAALFSPTSGQDAGHVIFYAGAERDSNNGDSFMGFWLFKSAVGCNSPTGSATPFSGQHSVGDLLILTNFTGGGSTPLVQVYKWVGSGGSDGPLDLIHSGVSCTLALPGDDACGAPNTSPFQTPWAPSNTAATALKSNEFVEVGVDLTSLLDLNIDTIPCFARFQAETRSSQQTTATLKDFAAGNFNSCTSTTVTTPKAGTTTLNDSTPVPSSTVIHDDAMVTGHALIGTAPNPTGTVTFSYCRTADQTSGGSTACDASGSTSAGVIPLPGSSVSQTVSSNNIAANTLLAGRYCFTATYADTSTPPNYPDGSSDSSKTECFLIGNPHLTILKTADAASVNAGDPIGFTITVGNDGESTATNVTLSDPLPAGSGTGVTWSVDQQPSQGSCSTSGLPPTQSLSCSFGDLAAGGSLSLHITATTSASECTSYDNTATAHSDNDGSPFSEASIACLPAQVSITKKADHSAPVHAGDSIGFTVEVKNTGGGDATGVVLNDPLPLGSGSGVTWAIDAATGTPGQFVLSGAKGSQVLSLASGTLPAGADYTVHITAATSQTECGTYDNTATLTTGNANNPNPASADESCAFRVDLSVTKAGSPATQTLGDGNITWTIVVTNNGPDTDTGVTIADPMPAGNTFVSATTSQGTCTGGAILNCNIGTMAAGASVTITLVTTPSTVGAQTNTVNVVGARPETNTANNTASATVQTVGVITPPVFCVAVSKVTPKQLFVGRKTTLTIHLTQGGKAVKGIHVRIEGAKINVRTGASNSKGVIKHTLKMKKAGILVFTPIASKACNTKRVGVTNVFTPPVTG